MMTMPTRQTAMFNQTIPNTNRRILVVFDETNSAANRQIAFDKITATATRQFFSMPNEIIPAATRPIFRWIRNFAHGLLFLALAAALTFPLLNPKAAPLHDAARDGNLDEVNRLIATGADVNAKEDKYGVVWTPLHFACNHGHEDVIKALLAAGADVDAKDEGGWTPLHWSQNVDVVSALLAAGADVDAKDNNGKTPLHLSWRNADVANALIAAGADVNTKDNNGETLLHDAIQKRTGNFANAKLDEVNRLIASGVNVNAKDNKGRTPLHRAIDYGYHSIVEALLAAGANVNAKSNTGWTPLHMVGRHGHVESINVLIAAGADLNALNDNGETPLDIAILHDGYISREILMLLSSDSTSPAEPGEPTEEQIVGASALTIERVGERTEVRWQGGVLQFSPEVNGRWHDMILDQGFFRLRRQD